jgi:hypothetical protein
MTTSDYIVFAAIGFDVLLGILLAYGVYFLVKGNRNAQ